MLDFVAQRYSVLPSELLVKGSSLDIVISGVAQEYMNEQQIKAEAERSGRAYVKRDKSLTPGQMQKMLDRVKAKE
jgi:hypothetical protein